MGHEERAQLSSETATRVERFVADWSDTYDIPGVSVAVTTAEETVTEFGVGSRSLAENDPATPQTLYGVGSVTKSVTALAVLKLVDDGILDVTDPIDEHLEIQIPGDRAPTIHELLTHSSGIPSLGTSTVLLARQAEMEELGIPLGDREDFYRYIEMASNERLTDRERFMYCNAAYVLLADLIPALHDQSFAEFVDESILAPLEMNRATFDPAELERNKDALTPYRFDENDQPVSTPFPSRELSLGPGGLIASVTDLAKYLRYQLKPHHDERQQICDPELLSTAHQPHVETPAGPYGYGWRRRHLADELVIGHGGSIVVSTASVGFFPESDFGVAMAANASPGHSLIHPMLGIAAIVQGADPEIVPFFRRSSIFDELTGNYHAYRGVRTARIERRGGVLELEASGPFGTDRTTLIPTDPALEEREFVAHGDAGREIPVSIVEENGHLDLVIGRWRYHHEDHCSDIDRSN